MAIKKQPRPIRLTRRALRRALVNEGLGSLNIVFFDETDSTNTRARLYAEGCADKKRCNTLFVARKQRGGRGRMGRRFISDGESGLWMSLLRFDRAPESALFDTTRAAVAVCRAIEELVCESGGECRASVKWVNDIFLGGKKLSGILAEGGYAAEGEISYSVVGIGVNLYKTDLPDELLPIATSLFEQCGIVLDRAVLAARIVRELLCECVREDVMKEYRDRSFILGRAVEVRRGNESYSAIAEDIDSDGALIVTDRDNNRIKLNSGEVSIRQIPNTGE